jgi:solute carrier family 25 S-adenosylmethionine transporter 26
MLCGAVSRSIAQTVMHPANTLKTIYQGGNTIAFDGNMLKTLSRGAGAQFLMSIPNGAMNFAMLESTRQFMSRAGARRHSRWSNNFTLDFISSAIATVACSTVSTPQMMITDNIMAGNYPNLIAASRGLYAANGIRGFYTAWFPGVVGKIPSYGLTWVLFQQLKAAQLKIMKREPSNLDNTVMGCLSSAATVAIMIPMDTVKTRLVTQNANRQYSGIMDCARQVLAKEGPRAFYKGLPPRLLSVVPMIGIQFGVYEFAKKLILRLNADLKPGYKLGTS